jgi:hypothetical protein
LARQLKDLGRFLYLSCWRPVEMKTLLVGLSTLPGCAVRPRSANSNTKHPRLLKLDGRLLDIIQRAHAAHRLDCLYVFHRPILPGSLGLVWYGWRL